MNKKGLCILSCILIGISMPTSGADLALATLYFHEKKFGYGFVYLLIGIYLFGQGFYHARKLLFLLKEGRKE